ncbi:hypothetical protein DdX_09171 [Ditylenchus destructor]|uniref:G-protein coupled receptors family 2 profile 2 domain-containing protein n=1 Tax=Ditylenchus destructor TaxID=166010 RepID=A0AAD4N683_9BILA|nr:hypothetical protein DdX_09171 [Ditylenchus destructor]
MIYKVTICLLILLTLSTLCLPSKVTYYAYIESCKDRLCYSVNGISITYYYDSKAISLLCATPTPLRAEETLRPADMRAANSKGYNGGFVEAGGRKFCNNSEPLYFKFLNGFDSTYLDKSHGVSLFMAYENYDNSGILYLKFNESGSLRLDLSYGTNLTIDDSQWNCSVYEHQSTRACVCLENRSMEFCLKMPSEKFDPIVSSIEYYHIYGSLTWGDVLYHYYFEIFNNHNKDHFHFRCETFSILYDTGGEENISVIGISVNSTATSPDRSGYYYQRRCFAKDEANLSVLKEKYDNFTVFVDLPHTTKNGKEYMWHSLLWFHWPTWSGRYKPGKCSHQNETFPEDNTHIFSVCMRWNVTEKFYNGILQEYGSSTAITVPFASTTEDHTSFQTERSNNNSILKMNPTMSPLLSADELAEVIYGLSQTKNISKEAVVNVLSALDAVMNGTLAKAKLHDPKILQSLNSIVKNSCCDINFVGNSSLVVRRQTVSCTMTPIQDWPVMRDVPRNSILNASENNGDQISIKIPYETVCSEEDDDGYILIYYFFANMQFFVEQNKHKEGQREDKCLSKQRIQQNFPVLSGQLIMKSTFEAKHQIVKGDEYKVMATIMFPTQILPTNIHGTIKLVCWNGSKWVDTNNSKTVVENGHYVYTTNHLTDFTLIVVGTEIDPFLCDNVLEFISILLNFLSFCGLLILISSLIIKRCILVTTFQSLHILKILTNASPVERLILYIIGRRFMVLVSLGIPTAIVLILKISMPRLFDRHDDFCWIRPDYIIPSVVVPLSILGFNSLFIFGFIFIRVVAQGKLFGIYVKFGRSSVRTIISTSSTRSDESSSSTTSIVSTGAKHLEKAFSLLCIELMLGLPWVCQYLTLFAPQVTAAHYIFTIAIGSQGLVFIILHFYKKLRRHFFISPAYRSTSPLKYVLYKPKTEPSFHWRSIEEVARTGPIATQKVRQRDRLKRDHVPTTPKHPPTPCSCSSTSSTCSTVHLDRSSGPELAPVQMSSLFPLSDEVGLPFW